jgi:hypothetical protein
LSNTKNDRNLLLVRIGERDFVEGELPHLRMEGNGLTKPPYP